jgi:hypothetical protein
MNRNKQDEQQAWFFYHDFWREKKRSENRERETLAVEFNEEGTTRIMVEGVSSPHPEPRIYNAGAREDRAKRHRLNFFWLRSFLRDPTSPFHSHVADTCLLLKNSKFLFFFFWKFKFLSFWEESL